MAWRRRLLIALRRARKAIQKRFSVKPPSSQRPPRLIPVSADTLPDDIIFTILMKFPVKSLLTFRCVCKNWNSIITSQDFMHKYSISSPQRYLIIHSSNPGNNVLFSTLSESPFVVMSDQEMPSGDMYCVCNGLFCFYSTLNNQICLWNPSIRKHKILTTISLLFEEVNPRTRLAYTSIGMGFDSNTNDYKIIKLTYVRGRLSREWDQAVRPKPKAAVYSLSSDSWRSLETPDNLVEKFDNKYNSSGVYWNGAFHWLAKFIGEERRCYLSILRFDVCEERFEQMGLPPDYPKSLQPCDSKLVVFKGLLGIQFKVENREDERLTGYIWTINGGIWIKERLIKASIFCGYHIETFNKHRICLVDRETKLKVFEIWQPLSYHAYYESLALL